MSEAFEEQLQLDAVTVSLLSLSQFPCSGVPETPMPLHALRGFVTLERPRVPWSAILGLIWN